MDKSHQTKVAVIQKQLAESAKDNKTVHFKRTSTNSTRARRAINGAVELDLTTLNDIVGLNAAENYIDVEPGVPMDALVMATLKANLIPLVVPEFPGITVGGAVQGGALESSSYRYGQLNDTVLEYELLLTDGTLIVATADNAYSDLYYGLATSHGTLAVVTRIRLRLTAAARFVTLAIEPCPSPAACLETLRRHTGAGTADFIEGLLFSETAGAVITGTLSDTATAPVRRFWRNIDPWYHRFMRRAAETGVTAISVPLVDYLFRYDKGAFWMGEHLFPLFGVKSNPVTRFFLAPISRTRKLYDGLHAMNVQHEYIVQDFYMDWTDASKIIDFDVRGPKIFPVWLCPIKATTTPQKLSSHYREQEQMLLNVGIYGMPEGGNAVGDTIALENLFLDTPNRKMLYAQTFYEQAAFWRKYDQAWYGSLRRKYNAEPFRDVWSKVHTPTSAFQSRRVRGFIQVAVEALWGKNVVWRVPKA
ncbi:FAD-binding oxidoreductase [Blastochloris viridis]|nr:FAD-binding protein [Blastochloris viridis]BAS00626.1 hypothetical protein BV133_3032 [Blastochloris viridis]